MVRRMTLVLVCLVLVLGGAACVPKLVGPTPGSGFVFSLQVSEPLVWLGPVEPAVARQFPQATALIVRVQDAQGRPVDGVPVTFELEPRWVGSATISPSQTHTSGGIARAILSEPRTIGVVRVMAHVDNMTAQARLTVMNYEPRHLPGLER
jgi:hypothetical protein